MCQLCLADNPTRGQVIEYDLQMQVRELTAPTYVRRRDRVIGPVAGRIEDDLRYVFEQERIRVLDLLKQAVLPYRPGQVREADIRNVDGLNQLLMSGVSDQQYAAVLEDGYAATMPGAIDATLLLTLSSVGLRYRVSNGIIYVRMGGDLFRVMRFQDAERWVRDHAIEFSRRWAPTVTDRTNKLIRAQLAEGFKKGEGIDRLVERIKGVYQQASDVRAKMIARTESSRAYNAAMQEMGQRLGVRSKYWIISGTPYSLVDVCSDNANMGTIPMTSSFMDTYGLPISGPPAHPNCLCSMGLDVSDNWGLADEFLMAA